MIRHVIRRPDFPPRLGEVRPLDTWCGGVIVEEDNPPYGSVDHALQALELGDHLGGSPCKGCVVKILALIQKEAQDDDLLDEIAFELEARAADCLDPERPLGPSPMQAEYIDGLLAKFRQWRRTPKPSTSALEESLLAYARALRRSCFPGALNRLTVAELLERFIVSARAGKSMDFDNH